MADSTFQLPSYAASGVPDGSFPFTSLLQQLTAGYNAFPTASYGRFNGTGVTQDLGYPSGVNAGPASGYGIPQPSMGNVMGQPQGGLSGAGGMGGLSGAAGYGTSQPQGAGGGAGGGLLATDIPRGDGTYLRQTSQAAAGMTPQEQAARAMLPYASNQMGLYSALGQEMAQRGMSQSDIANALNSFGGTAGANGGAQLAQMRQQYGTNYGNAFANTPFAQFFQNRTAPAPTSGSMRLGGLIG